MKYLIDFKKYNINEYSAYNNYDIYDLEIDFVIASDYVSDNYDWEKYYKSLGKEIFDFMGDYERNKYYDDLIDKFVNNTTYKDIADWDEERLRDYIIDNEDCYIDNLDFDENEDVNFDNYIDKLDTTEIIKIFEDNDNYTGCNSMYLYNEAHSQYNHYNSIEDFFEFVEKDEDYYNILDGYFDKDKAIDRILENDDGVREFYLEDIQTSDHLKATLIEYEESNIDILFHLLDKNNEYCKDTYFQKKYIDYTIENHIKDDNDNVNEDDAIDLEKNINDKYGITEEAQKYLMSYVKKSRARKFNL